MTARTVSSAPRPTVPEEVRAFARQEGVERYLTELIELARQVYPTATRFDVFTEDDPEIVNDWHIIFELDVPLTLEQAQEANWKWYQGIFDIVPAPLTCVFRLSADLRP